MHKSKRVGHAVRYIKREKQTDERMHRGARIGVSLRSVSTCVLQIEREREKKKEREFLFIGSERGGGRQYQREKTLRSLIIVVVVVV